jgi:small-conductance mechanosensitive channel
MDVVKECPYTVDDPAPRVLLNNLAEYSIDFRIFAWIDNYADQWPARDWILQRVFQRFGEEGIQIPFPTSIELREQSTGISEAAMKRKRAHQNSARIQMSKDEKFYLEERDSLKVYVEGLEKQVSDTMLSSRVRDRIRTEISQINKTLERFDAEN